MTGIVPELDDLEFDALVDESIGILPRFAPGHTDHNLHDPGITLIELLAWDIDRILYRTGFVGDSLLTSFAGLLGVKSAGPSAARALIWPDAGLSRPHLILAAGMSATTRDDPDAHFTLDHDVRLTAARIETVVLIGDDGIEPQGNGVVTGNHPIRIAPFAGGGPRALEIRFDAQLGGAPKPVALGFGIHTDDPQAAGWDPVGIEERAGPSVWGALKVLHDGTKGMTRSGVLTIEPKAMDAKTELRLRLDQGLRPGTFTIERLDINVLPVSEGREDRDEVLGIGNGLPDQEFELGTKDVVGLEKTLAIFTGVAGARMAWKRVRNFAASGPADRHFVLRDNTVLFGNGVNGRIPANGAQILREPLRRTRGERGNLAAGLTWQIANADFGKNLYPATGGADATGIENLKAMARAGAQSRRGLLAAEDLERAARRVGLGLEDVHVLARHTPGLEDHETPGARTVLAIPSRPPSAIPTPNDAVLAELRKRLECRRLLGERLYVSAPIYAEIDVEAELVVMDDVDPATVSAAARDRVRTRLWDLPRTQEQTLEPWPPGRPVTCGEIESLFAELASVVRVHGCRIARAGADLGTEPIQLDSREIALSREVRITAMRDRGERMQ